MTLEKAIQGYLLLVRRRCVEGEVAENEVAAQVQRCTEELQTCYVQKLREHITDRYASMREFLDIPDMPLEECVSFLKEWAENDVQFLTGLQDDYQEGRKYFAVLGERLLQINLQKDFFSGAPASFAPLYRPCR